MDDDLSTNDVRISVPIVAEINISENLVAEVVNPIDVEFTPKLNVQFDTEEEACDFYNAYGGKVGFSIRKDYANKSRKTDLRMIIDYGHFGDVITFDTTYKLVKSNRPFAAFLGLNHHRETAVFGLALMYDETANSFAWLFDSFLNAMSGKVPQTILTDQDGAMVKALAQVMPRIRHLLCTWHIMANAQKHVGTIFRNDGGIKSVLSQFMYCYDDEDDFYIQWDVMLREYNVVGNTWLNNLFGLREKWGYPFVKHWFTAGIRTTQLSEGLNSCLKEYLTRKMSIPDFFMHLDRLLSDKRYKEYQAEYGLLSKLPRLKQNCPILKQVGNMYMLKIFKLFQDQFIEACVVATMEGTSLDENGLRVFRVSVHDGSMDRTVTRWDDGFLSCSCGKYAMKGILCSHVLKVLKDDTHYFKELPYMYILKRWTRKAKDNRIQDIRGCEVIADPKLEKSNGNNSVGAGVSGSGTVPPITYVRLNGCDIPSDTTWIYKDHHPCARLHSETNIDQMTYCPTTNFNHPITPPTEQGTPFVSYHECRFSDNLDVDHTSGDRNLMPMSEETTSEINPPAWQKLF
ncbi:protein FAR1-RELATED SEQUENCE 5-like [Cornus florida]|uniref:protein FAR1-RELATED SEQUENCE 5-like n=1 Tax=Cornus florida TaxID=4283 RepID=UPI00289B5D13|nr:protein FAR1-RELATED SEQUENCE 5-like [Cornus florida]